jgi:hypothetical protein
LAVVPKGHFIISTSPRARCRDSGREVSSNSHWIDPPGGGCTGGQGDVQQTNTWSEPPDRLVPGETLAVDLYSSISATQNCGEKYTSTGITAHINGGRWDASGIEGWTSGPFTPVSKTIEWLVPEGSPGATLEIDFDVAYVGRATYLYTYQ